METKITSDIVTTSKKSTRYKFVFALVSILIFFLTITFLAIQIIQIIKSKRSNNANLGTTIEEEKAQEIQDKKSEKEAYIGRHIKIKDVKVENSYTSVDFYSIVPISWGVETKEPNNEALTNQLCKEVIIKSPDNNNELIIKIFCKEKKTEEYSNNRKDKIKIIEGTYQNEYFIATIETKKSSENEKNRIEEITSSMKILTP